MVIFKSLKTALVQGGEILKWLVLATLTGVVCSLAGVLFHYAVDEVTCMREAHEEFLFLLPVAGVIIVFLYHICKLDNDKGTNTVILAVRKNEKVSPFLAPLIFAGTVLTHLCGGSSGREGAALQIGGGIGSVIAKAFRLHERGTTVVIMCGMSAVFSAVFGTPLTAALFTVEVACVGIMHYSLLLPVLVSSVAAFVTASAFGITATKFTLATIPSFEPITLLKVSAVAVLGGIVSVLFVVLMHNATELWTKRVPNKYLRIILGSITVILLTYLFGTTDYNGAGMAFVKSALENGEAGSFAFILKMLLTVATLSVGFKGGEIVPSFFIGSTFGVFIAPLFGISPSFAAAVGLISVFCGVVNCPVATIILSVELFGSEGLLYFAVATILSYVVSGNYSLYSAQKIVYSKIRSSFIESDSH